jgi:DNA-binding MurR/RpiR family transcriptional regulator
LKLGKFTPTKGAPIIAITDSPMSLLATLSEISFYIPVILLPFGKSYTAPIAFLTVLCSEFSNRFPEQVLKNHQKRNSLSQEALCILSFPQ